MQQALERGVAWMRRQRAFRTRKGHVPPPRSLSAPYFVTLSGVTTFGASVGAVCRCRCKRDRLVADATFFGLLAAAAFAGVAVGFGELKTFAGLIAGDGLGDGCAARTGVASKLIAASDTAKRCII